MRAACWIGWADDCLPAPCRDAERRFHNHAMELFEEAADYDA
ncbi:MULTISPECIES: hypothetical protein [Streptomyces]|uniref:Uncharacterized protein n=1 Tax=Streptomyces bobili TaxID=67280 RepID=A0ABZ1QPP5_9ACTN|nr:hypothetical protein [Streptomyces bobili]